MGLEQRANLTGQALVAAAVEIADDRDGHPTLRLALNSGLC